MTLADVREIADYWAEHPPVHLLLAAFIGFKPEPTIEGGSCRRTCPSRFSILMR
jgi:hypothetical protein